MKILGTIFLIIINIFLWLYTISFGYHEVLQYHFKDLPDLGYLAIYGLNTMISLFKVNIFLNVFMNENTKNKIKHSHVQLVSFFTALIFLLSFYIQTLFQ